MARLQQGPTFINLYQLETVVNSWFVCQGPQFGEKGVGSASIISEGEWVGPAVVVFIVVVADDGGLVALISHI